MLFSRKGLGITNHIFQLLLFCLKPLKINIFGSSNITSEDCDAMTVRSVHIKSYCQQIRMRSTAFFCQK